MAGKAKLNEADFSRGAARLDVLVPAIKAVTEVEAPNGGFLASGEVRILFERHWFSRLTQGKWDATHPAISNPVSGGYIGGQAEHGRLQEAVALDRVAALKSASWGKFQIMGLNHELAGFADIQAFINAVSRDEGSQLDAFCNFILHPDNRALHRALQAREWKTFARLYNGKNYAKNEYDIRLAAAYRKFGGK